MFGSQTRFLRPASRSLLEAEVERIEDTVFTNVKDW